MTPRDLARFLGGDATARGANVPGPGHSAKDRSLSILLLPTAPLGFIVYSHAGDDWRECRDYVARKLGLKPCRRADPAKLPMAGRAERASDSIAWALMIWREGRPLMSAASAYLRSRGLLVPNELICRVLRHHPKHGLLALFRDIHSDEPCGIQRVFITPHGQKIGRKMLGRSKGAAIKIDADEEVTYGVVIGEGVETCLAARQLGLKPVWALGTASAVGNFPALPGMDALTILAERNKDGTPNAASKRNVTKCAARWHAAGREVIVVGPFEGQKDANDALISGRRTP